MFEVVKNFFVFQFLWGELSVSGTDYYTYSPAAFRLVGTSADSIVAGAPSSRPGFYNYTESFDFPSEMQLTWKSYAQVNQDETVVKILGEGNNTGGFFVDLASNHWKRLSNTLLLEVTYKWQGICVEPNLEYRDELLKYRRCRVVTSPVSSQSNENVLFRLDGVVGGIVEGEMDNNPGEKGRGGEDVDEVTLATVTLSVLLNNLNAPHIIDYMSLDVEGAEYYVLKHHDFGRHHFKILSIERPIERLHKLLTSHNYHWLAMLGDFGDCMYIHYTIPNFNKIMHEYAPNRLSTLWESRPFAPKSNHDYMINSYKIINHEYV